MSGEYTYYIDHPFTNGASISLHPVRIQGHFYKHAHTCYEISYIVEGQGTLSISGDTFTVSKGDLIYIPYGEEHLFQSRSQDDSTPLEVMNCLFKKQILMIPKGPTFDQIHDDFDQLTLIFRNCASYIRVRENEKEFSRILYAIEMEQKCKSTGFQYKIYLRFMDLLNYIQLAMNYFAKISEETIGNPVQYAIDHITRHYKNPLTVDEICKQFMISSRHFQRKFKEHTHTSYTKMLQEIRIYHSSELLLDTDWSVQTVALEVGLQDMKHFYRLFRERFGVTPCEFRNA